VEEAIEEKVAREEREETAKIEKRPATIGPSRGM